MLALERYFPHYMREKAEEVLFALSIFFLSFSTLFLIATNTPFGKLWPIAEGLFLVCFGLLLKTILIEIYFHSLRRRLEAEQEMSFATFLVIGLHHPKKKDLAKAFLHSRLGREVTERLGIAKETIHDFMLHKDISDVAIPSRGAFPELAAHLHDSDPYFRDFLDRVQVSRDHLISSSREVEGKHHRKLDARPFLSTAFYRKQVPSFSLERAARNEIEELERFYRIIITEQATAKIVEFFREDMLRYVSENARVDLITELIEHCLNAHKERFHGASIILPADARSFLISKKA